MFDNEKKKKIPVKHSEDSNQLSSTASALQSMQNPNHQPSAINAETGAVNDTQVNAITGQKNSDSINDVQAHNVQGSHAAGVANLDLAQSTAAEASTGLGGKRERDENLGEKHGAALVSDNKGGYGIVSDEEVIEKKEHAAEEDNASTNTSNSAYDRMMNPYAIRAPSPDQ